MNIQQYSPALAQHMEDRLLASMPGAGVSTLLKTGGSKPRKRKRDYGPNKQTIENQKLVYEALKGAKEPMGREELAAAALIETEFGIKTTITRMVKAGLIRKVGAQAKTKYVLGDVDLDTSGYIVIKVKRFLRGNPRSTNLEVSEGTGIAKNDTSTILKRLFDRGELAREKCDAYLWSLT